MTNKINSIDVSECPLFDKNTGCYHTFNGECVKDSCAVYKWLLEYKRLQEENKSLQMLSCANCGEKYLSPDGSELYDKNVQLKTENAKYKQALEEIRTFAKPIKENTCFGMYCGFVDWILETINEALEDNKDDTTINKQTNN